MKLIGLSNSGGDSTGGKEVTDMRVTEKEESPRPQSSCCEPLLY